MDICSASGFDGFPNDEFMEKDDFITINTDIIQRLLKKDKAYKKIIGLAGINGAGKDTLINFLESSRDDIVRIRLRTSRPPRKGSTLTEYPAFIEDKQGIINEDIGSYIFTSKEDLEKNMQRAVYFRKKGDNLYALMQEDIKPKITEARRNNKILLIPGVFTTLLVLKKEIFKNMYIIYLKTPVNHLRQRLEEREKHNHKRENLTPREQKNIDRIIEDAQRYNILAYTLSDPGFRNYNFINCIVENRDEELLKTTEAISNIMDKKIAPRIKRLNLTKI